MWNCSEESCILKVSGMDEHKTYFCLDRFAHRDLWKKKEPVWSPLHILEEYFRSKSFKIEIKILPGVHLERSELISIGKGTVIEPGVYIQGPCILGNHCILRHGAYLRGGVICGNGCAIGHSAEIKHAILLDAAAATHFTYVGDSIIGNGVNLGAGVKCANLRFDRREVVVDAVKTRLKKLGAIIGDRVQIGCNTVLNPGTLIGHSSIIDPLIHFGGVIPPQSRVIGEKKHRVEPFVGMRDLHVP